MVAFVLNRHGRMVFPSNISPELNFSRSSRWSRSTRSSGATSRPKAPSGIDILERVGTGAYDSRYALMPNMALNLFLANRFSITMHEKRSTRWAVVGTPDLEYHTLDLPTKDHGVLGLTTFTAEPGPPSERWPQAAGQLGGDHDRRDRPCDGSTLSWAAGVAPQENRARLDPLAARRLTDDPSHDHEGPAETAV